VRIITIPGVATRIALLDMPGSDPNAPVRVFLHGLGSSSIATFPELAAHRMLRHSRSILIDLPGFGYSSATGSAMGSTRVGTTDEGSSSSHDSQAFGMESQADVVAHVLEHLGLSQVHMVGHSMGGSIAIAVAYARPDLVAHLIVAEPNLDPGHGTLSNHIIRRTETAFIEDGYPRLVRGMEEQANWGEENAAVFLGTLLQASPLVMHRAATSLLAERTPTFREQFLNVRMPRTFIGGANSSDVLASDLTSHGITFVEIPNAGHLMMDDDPDAFAQAVARPPCTALPDTCT